MMRWWKQVWHPRGRDGRSRAGLRALGLRALGIGALATALACVVTDNSDLPTPTDYPLVRGTSPSYLTRLKSVSDPDCAMPDGEPATKFEVFIRYEDVSSDLFLQVRVNGAAQTLPPGSQTVTLPHVVPGDPRRNTPDLCVKNSALSLPCNTVEVVVATSTEKASIPVLVDDPEVQFAQWIVLGPASGDYADVSLEACAPPLKVDGGL